LTSGNSGIMFSIKRTPCGMFHISLGLTIFDSLVDTIKFSNGGGKHAFSISEKCLGVFDSLVTDISGGCVGISVVGILGEESVAGSSGFGVDAVGSCLLCVEFGNETIDESYYLVKVSLSRGHVD